MHVAKSLPDEVNGKRKRFLSFIFLPRLKMLQNIGNAAAAAAAKDQAPRRVPPLIFLLISCAAPTSPHHPTPSLCSYMHRYKSHLHTESCDWERSCNSRAFFGR